RRSEDQILPPPPKWKNPHPVQLSGGSSHSQCHPPAAAKAKCPCTGRCQAAHQSGTDSRGESASTHTSVTIRESRRCLPVAGCTASSTQQLRVRLSRSQSTEALQ